jgi:aldose 1-epimerase
LHQAAYIRFTYISSDGEEGFPGELITSAIYTLDHTGSVRLDLRAECETATVANLTNHAYFNLSGLSATSIGDHCLQIFSQQYLECDHSTLPTGKICSVESTPFNFQSPKAIGTYLNGDPALADTRGYDHTLVIQGEVGHLRPTATLSHPASGRIVNVSTTAPALVIYTGNWLNEVGEGALGKAGKPYDNHSGIALETQNYPDAPNHPHFPSARVDATHPFVQTTVWQPSLQA